MVNFEKSGQACNSVIFQLMARQKAKFSLHWQPRILWVGAAQVVDITKEWTGKNLVFSIRTAFGSPQSPFKGDRNARDRPT
jgi:hypothetical protein